MSTLKEIRSLYAPLTPTSAEPRAYVGKAAPGDYRHIFGDDSGDYAPSGPSFPTKAEALATISARAAEYYGTAQSRRPRPMSEPRVLARYDPTTPANIAFREAQRNAPDAQLLLDLGQLRMALQDIEDRYSMYLHSGRLLSAQVEDRLRMLVLQEISAIEAILSHV